MKSPVRLTALQSGRVGPYKVNPLMSRFLIQRRLLTYQAVGFISIIALIQLNEILDLPCLLLGAPPTEINWNEAALESCVTAIMGLLVIWLSRAFLLRIKHLEGFLVVCSFCKRIRIEDTEWTPMEQFISDRAEVVFSHGFCPKCAEEHYGHVLRSGDREARHGRASGY